VDPLISGSGRQAIKLGKSGPFELQTLNHPILEAKLNWTKTGRNMEQGPVTSCSLGQAVAAVQPCICVSVGVHCAPPPLRHHLSRAAPKHGRGQQRKCGNGQIHDFKWSSCYFSPLCRRISSAASNYRCCGTGGRISREEVTREQTTTERERERHFSSWTYSCQNEDTREK
jgi:hypothetical protein